MKKKPVLFFGKFLRSSARPQDYAKAPLLFQGKGSRVDSGRAQGFGRRRQGKGQYPGDMLTLPLVHPVQLIKVRNLARDLHRNFRRVETRDAPNPAFPRQYSLGERGVPNAIRAHRAHARNHHPSLHAVTPI